MLEAIAAALTPELLKPSYRNLAGGPTAGHCYHAAEALWHMLGGKDSGYTPHVAKDDAGITHWWLQGAAGRLDPTADQYLSQGLQPPYERGRGCGFLTRQPSRRAMIVILRARIDSLD